MTREPAIDPVAEMAAKAESFDWYGNIAYASVFEAPMLNAVLALWREKAPAGLPPLTAFNGPDFAFALPNLWMLEEVAGTVAPRYRYRHVGTEIAPVFGPVRGRYIDEIIPLDQLPRWTEACVALLRCRAPVRVSSNVQVPHSGNLRIESFHAPVLDAGGRPTILMCVSVFSPRKET